MNLGACACNLGREPLGLGAGVAKVGLGAGVANLGLGASAGNRELAIWSCQLGLEYKREGGRELVTLSFVLDRRIELLFEE